MRDAPGVLVIAPAWAASGSFQVFKSQCNILKSFGFEIYFVAVPDFWGDRAEHKAAAADYRSQARTLGADHLAVPRLPIAGKNKKSAIFDKKYTMSSEALKATKCSELLALPLSAIYFVMAKKELLVLCNHYFNIPYAKRLLRYRRASTPMIVETHDIQAKQFKSIFSLSDEAYEASLQDELTMLRDADCLIHISNTEHKFFVDALPSVKHRMIYPYIAPGERRPVVAADVSYLIVASWTHANAYSLDWFLNDVWGKYQGDATLMIVGNIDECMRDLYPETYARWRQCFVGCVDDLAKYYERASVVLLPMKQGEGIAIKFAEALAHGKRMLFTPEAARGLPADIKTEFADSLCETADDFLTKMQAMKDLAIVEFDQKSFGLYERLFAWDRYRANYKDVISTYIDIPETA